MSLLKDVKKVLKSNEVEELLIDMEDGSTQQIVIEGRSMAAIEQQLAAINWELVAEVQAVVEDEDDDDDDDEDDKAEKEKEKVKKEEKALKKAEKEAKKRAEKLEKEEKKKQQKDKHRQNKHVEVQQFVEPLLPDDACCHGEDDDEE